MVIKTNELTEIVREQAYGGAGRLLCRVLLTEEQRKDELKICNRLRLEPGSEIGLHSHDTDFELYYILAGTGLLNDDGTPEKVGPGDLIYTSDGQKHALLNDSDDILELLAIVIDCNKAEK